MNNELILKAGMSNNWKCSSCYIAKTNNKGYLRVSSISSINTDGLKNMEGQVH
ncbi:MULTISPECIES: hypothetical protein [Clostridia]|jgi:hypothetical protein|uniref:hypothetical protein n=1 Tax=Clostridia TaxID=186801 RepID=UPI0002E67FF0|nr:hypothetical protein [Acetivibrio thermocellus]